MQEEELKRLVSEGEIRAFRDQDKMKFKKEDIERFRRQSSDSDADTLGDDDLTEELVFEEDDSDQEVGMATAAITDDSFLEDDEMPLALEEEPEPRSSARPKPGAQRRPRVVVDEPEATEGPVWAAAIILCTVFVGLGVVVAMDAAQGTGSAVGSGVADMIRGWFLS